MSDFFYRKCTVKLPEAGRIRNNAWVTVKGEKFSMPADTSDMASTYDPNKTGRPAPILKSVKVELKGDAGSLRQAEVAFTCFDKTSFELAEENLLLPGKTINIAYGYVGPEVQGEGAEHEFRVFDYSFKITKENYFDCTFKAVGKGGTYHSLDLYGLGKWPKKKFVTNFRGFDSKIEVGSLFDYIDYQIQITTGNTGYGFDPGHGKSGELSSPIKGHYGVLKAPEEYNATTKMAGGFWNADYLQYVSFGAVIDMINQFMLTPAKEKGVADHQIAFHPEWSSIQTVFPNGGKPCKIWSPDPTMMLFPYSKGVPENTYYDRPWRWSDKKKIISCDAFKQLPDGARMTSLRGIERPEKILLSRDLMRTIAKSLADDAVSGSPSKDDPDKASGGLPLHKLLGKIFSLIKEYSGGAWDMYLDQDEGDPVNVFIINRRSPGDGSGVEILMLDPVGGEKGVPPSNGIRSLDISGKVPKDIQAKAFGAAPETKATVDTINEETKEDDQPLSATEVFDKQINARKGLTEGDYATAPIDTAKAAIKLLVENISSKERAKLRQTNDGVDSQTQTPFPLEFTATLDGIEGFKFGDTIGSSYLPSRYLKEDSNDPKVVFTVVSYEHKIENNDWTTTVRAIARIR